MSMAPGFTATCLLEIPEGAPAVDLYYPMGPKLARKLVRVHPAGAELSSARRTQMLSRGVRLLWIKSSDEEALQKNLITATPSLSQLAHCLLDACLTAEDIAAYEASAKASLEIICRWINRPGVKLSPVWNELSQIALHQDLSTHAGRVATYAVLFAMAFDHVDPLFLSDLAIAGFLHDVGMLKAGNEKSHPDASIELIARLCPEIGERARLWISQHHERFGGGGYPLGLEGYKVDDISQLLAAADLLDDLSSGRWDEKCRGLRGAFEALEAFDREQTFPQFFNPDLLKTLLRWSSRTKSAAKSAAA